MINKINWQINSFDEDVGWHIGSECYYNTIHYPVDNIKKFGASPQISAWINIENI